MSGERLFLETDDARDCVSKYVVMAEKYPVDIVGSCIREVYRIHGSRSLERSCNLERSLSLREPFYCLRRVPRFHVRPDLHTAWDPAHTPLARLDDASIDDLTWKVPASCRKLLVEGDDGSGKTTICFRLIHGWHELWLKNPNMPEHCLYISGTDFCDDVCKDQYTREYFISLLGRNILRQINSSLQTTESIQTTEIQSWIHARASMTALIVDNVCHTSPVFEYICDILGDNELPFGRLVIFTKPGLLYKTHVDSLFYCYGLSLGYSHRVFNKRLLKQYGETDHIVSPILRFDPGLELFRNPQTTSLLANYMDLYLWDNGMDIPAPSCRLDLLESLIHVSTSNLITTCRQATRMCTTQEIKQLIDALETRAFMTFQTGSSYIQKSLLPEFFHAHHVCTMYFLYQLHGLGDVTEHVSFTSRCFKDYFASRYVCKTLNVCLRRGSAEDEDFKREVVSNRYSSLWSLCVRGYYRDRNYSALCWLLDSIMNKVHAQYNRHADGQGIEKTRSGLRALTKILECLKECEYEPFLTSKMSTRFPDTLEISCNQCSFDCLQNFISVCSVSAPPCLDVNVYWDKLNIEHTVTEPLSRALCRMRTLKGLVVRATSIDRTDQFVRFICSVFDNNPTVQCLTLGGPLNAVNNISQSERRNIWRIFSNPYTSLKKLVLENFNYHYRSMYILNVWPAIFHTLNIRKCSLDSAGKAIARHCDHSDHFRELSIEYCACPPKTLLLVFCGLRRCENLTCLRLCFLCTNRIVSKVYVKHPNFKTSFNEMVSSNLSGLFRYLPNLTELHLCYNGIDDSSASVILTGVSKANGIDFIDLSGNNMTDLSAQHLVNVLHALPNLHTLLVCENNLSPTGRKEIIKGSLDRPDIRLGL